MIDATLVIGSRGLLGSAITERLRARHGSIVLEPRVRWSTPAASDDLGSAIDELFAIDGLERWQILWCAGNAVTSASPDALRDELDVFRDFLDLLTVRGRGRWGEGLLFFASSAGGVYGGSLGAPFTEDTPSVSISGYGTTKLAAEALVRRFSAGTGTRSLVARIANLYGPGQSLAKPQGLISHLSRSFVTRRPISIYVPLDTRRDYLYSEDCADLVLAACDRLRREEPGSSILKILASGRSVTVGGLLGEFRVVAGRGLKVVMAQSPYAAAQSMDVRLASLTWPELDERTFVPLADGIARTLGQMRRTLALRGAESPR